MHACMYEGDVDRKTGAGVWKGFILREWKDGRLYGEKKQRL